MCQVVTIITPIDYACNLNNAIDSYTFATNSKLLDLDARILRVLQPEARGMRAGTVMRSLQQRIFTATFYSAINRLIKQHYIRREEHRKYVYYNITLKGRSALSQINEHLIRIVQEQVDKLNQHK